MFYGHAKNDTVWSQNLIYVFYDDDKTAYPLTFRLYEQHDDEDDDRDNKYSLARDMVTELEEEMGLPAETNRTRPTTSGRRSFPSPSWET